MSQTHDTVIKQCDSHVPVHTHSSEESASDKTTVSTAMFDHSRSKANEHKPLKQCPDKTHVSPSKQQLNAHSSREVTNFTRTSPGPSDVPHHSDRRTLNFYEPDKTPPTPHVQQTTQPSRLKGASPRRSALNQPEPHKERCLLPLSAATCISKQEIVDSTLADHPLEAAPPSVGASYKVGLQHQPTGGSPRKVIFFDRSKEFVSRMGKERLSLSEVSSSHSWPPPPPVLPLPLSQGPDGRHALNYGPRDAFDDLSSQGGTNGAEEETSSIENPEQVEPDELTIRKRRKKARWQRKVDRQQRTGKKQALDGHEEPSDPTADLSVPRSLSCPVCLDIFYNTYVVRPCGHSFCEPCLRRLAKYSQDADRSATCPVCRQPINFCIKDYDLTTHIQDYFPDDYYRRRRMEGNNKYMRHPLPASSPSGVSAKQIARVIASRTRALQRRPRVGSVPIRINVWRFLSVAIGFVLLKCMLLVILLCMYCMVYDHNIHVKLLQWSVSGIRMVTSLCAPKVWGLTGLFVFGASLALIMKHTTRHVWSRSLVAFKTRERMA